METEEEVKELEENLKQVEVKTFPFWLRLLMFLLIIAYIMLSLYFS